MMKVKFFVVKNFFLFNVRANIEVNYFTHPEGDKKR